MSEPTKQQSSALRVECAIAGLTLREVDPVPGEVVTATADEQIVLPDGCSFISTILPDGSREYRISEAMTDAEKLEAMFSGR